VELWFAKIQREVIRRGVFTSVADLGNKLRKYIRAYCKSAKPFRWTYTDLTRRICANKITGTAYSQLRSTASLDPRVEALILNRERVCDWVVRA